MTNAEGRYTFSKLPADGNYTITPVRERMSFTPPTIPFNKLRQDGSADFIVRKEPDRFKISGRVMDAKGPLGGVRVVLDGTKSASTTTDASGNYGFIELAAGGSYTITPKAQLNFTPASRSFTNLTHDGSADFFGVVKSDEHYKISGRVMDARQPLGGVTIKLEGSKLTSTTTDANGSYTFTHLRAGGAYTITPVARAPVSFTPSSRSFTNLTRDESADFSGLGQDDTKQCTDADRARERETFLERNAAAWERSIRSEEPKIIAATVRENLPGVEPRAVEATARLSPIKYEVSFLECTPRLVTARYEWQVRMFFNGTTKTVVVRKRKTCGKVVGVWLCR